MLTAPACWGSGVGLEGAPVNGVELGAEASNTREHGLQDQSKTGTFLPSLPMLKHPGLKDSQVLFRWILLDF